MLSENATTPIVHVSKISISSLYEQKLLGGGHTNARVVREYDDTLDVN